MSAVDVATAPGLGAREPGLACPSCGARGLAVFHEQSEIPVHSVRLVDTYEEARDFPRGALRLGFCERCGFITNTAYDPGPQDYAVAYEETQGFSPRFRQFSRDLAARWVEQYDLRGKHVLEIGSGKGEFLVDMCELGVAGGVGIDPSYVDGRLTSPAARRITFLNEYYSDAHAPLTGDAVVCRHTLEHIHATGELVRTVKRSLAGRDGTVVLFELPDVLRVLHEVAFWDVYYEHCSYFTPGSLARLFRLNGFDVLNLELDYDGQYILIECRQSDGIPSGPLPLEEDPAEVADAVRGFRQSLAATRHRLAGRAGKRPRRRPPHCDLGRGLEGRVVPHHARRAGRDRVRGRREPVQARQVHGGHGPARRGTRLLDETAVAERYDLQDPAIVAGELAAAAESIAQRYDALVGAPEETWARPGLRDNGTEFTVDSLSRYHLHDVLHHSHDVRHVAARATVTAYDGDTEEYSAATAS